jgi:intracellular protein transport protein USO1
MLRQISLGDTSSGEETVSMLQQINANVSTCLVNSADARIAVGYLILLSIWLFDDPLSVRDFLEESSGIQVLIGTIAQTHERIFVPGLAAVLIGICVEFNSNTSSLPPYFIRKY